MGCLCDEGYDTGPASSRDKLTIPPHAALPLDDESNLSVLSVDGSAELIIAANGQVVAIRSGTAAWPLPF